MRVGGSAAEPGTRRALLALVLAVALGLGPVDARGSDALGAVDTWILHYDPSAGEACRALHGALLEHASPGARFVVAVTTPSDIDLFCEEVGEAVARRSPRFVVTDSLLSPWARDRYLVFERRGATAVMIPAEVTIEADRRGDIDVALSLVELDASLELVRSDLQIEGGNVLVGDAVVFVGPDVVADNAAYLGGEAPVLDRLEALFDREVFVVGDLLELPHAHLDMFASVLPDDGILLGDPRLTLPHLESDGAGPIVYEGLGTFTPERQRAWACAYDRIARDLQDAGVRVVRAPVLHGEGGELLTWCNAVLECRPDETIAYVPMYGLPALDREAVEAWRRAGVRACGIPAGEIITLGGAVRCVSNVLRRGEPRRCVSGESTQR